MTSQNANSMLGRIGRVTQIAYVPGNWDAAIEFWTNVIGAGPFYELPHIPLINTQYRGEDTHVDISAVLGYWGDIQIELVRQHDETPSIYKEWADKPDRVQHIGVVVSDYEQAYQFLANNGGTAAFETEIPKAARATYFELPGIEHFVEILGLAPQFLSLWEKMKNTAREWDGITDPVRAVPPESEWS